MIRKSKKALAFLVFALMLYGQTHAQNERSLLGKWRNESDLKKETEFFVSSDGFYYGRITSDGETPSNKGKIIMRKLRYNQKEKSFVGEMSPPDRDINLSVTITFVTPNRIKVVGKKLFLSKTFFFERITEK